MSYKNAATAEELEAVIGGDVPVAEAEHAASADSAAQASKVGDANVGSSTRPVYLDAGTPKQCGNTLNVSISGNAATATSAQSAANAANAENAAHAASADTATNAQKAAEADHAASADTAQTAQTATSAERAVNATNAENAENADHATTADSATTAASATRASQDADGNVISSTYAKTAQVNNVSFVPDTGNAASISVPTVSGTRVQIDYNGWLCIAGSATGNGFIGLRIVDSSGADKWGAVNATFNCFSGYPIYFLPVHAGDYVKITWDADVTILKLQIIRTVSL